MTKTTKGPDYGKATAVLVKQVRDVIADGDKHRYSVSAVYGAYNTAFGKNDRPQTCSSCLRNRVRELRGWLAGYEKYIAAKEMKKDEKKPEAAVSSGAEEKTQDQAEKVTPQYDDPAAPGFVAPAIGVIRTPMADGLPFDFTPSKEDANRGTVILADGTAVKPGTYKSARGLDIAVQVGGKATIKGEDTPSSEDDLL